MKQVNGWDELESKEVVSSENLPVGIYVLKIEKVEDVVEQEYLKLFVDVVGVYDLETKKINKAHELVGFFKKNHIGKDWHSQGTLYRSYKDTAMVFFRAFITAIEKSNPKFVWDWNEDKLLNQFCVGVYDEEEYMASNGEVKVSVKCREIRSLEALKDGDVKLLGLKKLRNAPANNTQNNSKDPFAGLMTGKVEISEDDLPF